MEKPFFSLLRFAVLALPIFLSGCQSAMSTSSDSSHPRSDFPLKFKAHNFSAYCFETIGCKVLYDNRYDVRDGDDKLSRPLTAEFFSRLDATTLGIRNFPPPAVVTWRSKDGVPHEARIDIGEIFKDRRVLHNVAEKDIPERAYIRDPDVVLVVNDRTISVYMRVSIPLKEPRVPGNKYSNYQSDLVLAYSHSY